MIATGGLLRINARRQDSLRSKPHKPHTHKKKKKKRRSEVVVVKGKLKLCSLSGLVAALGVMVLMVGVVMAALGYWPHDGLFFSAQPQEGAAMASVSSHSDTAPAGLEGKPEEELGRAEGAAGGAAGGGAGGGLSQSENVTMAPPSPSPPPMSFLEDFLDRYLYSDRLKVLGPLIMGIGIFLFICANAVLHENRDKKTKVISLRDIYSTVIDLHSSSSGSAPRASSNGLVNYVQSKNLEVKPRAYPASLSRRDGGGGGGAASPCQPEGGGAEGGAVFSVCQEQQEQCRVPPATSSSSSHRLPLPQSFSPTLFLHRDTPSSFTLPLRRPRSAAPFRRHSARARTSQREEAQEEEEVLERRDEGGDQYELLAPPLSSSTPPNHREAPQSSRTLLLLSSSSLSPSHLSLSSLAHLLSSSPTPAPPMRRRSLPTASLLTGYTKLPRGEEGPSFDSTSLHHAVMSPQTLS